MDIQKDYYKILGITEETPKDEISKRYKKLAKENHPDLHPGDKEKEEKFKEITEAYEVLSDESKRSEYDNMRRYGASGPMGGMDDFFGAMFGNRGFGGGRGFGGFSFKQDKRMDGSDTIVECVVSFNEFIKGCQKEITTPLTKMCHHCHGTGSKSGKKSPCPRCSGTGYEEIIRDNGRTRMITTCHLCHGTGEFANPEDRCPHCHGQGMVEKTTTIRVDIPAGKVGPLQTNIQGNDGLHGGRCGSVYIKVVVNNDSPFEIRQDLSLNVRITITAFEAMLGIEKRIITPHGPTVIKIPAGTQHGTRLRIPNKGVPIVNKKEITPLYVDIVVEVPSNLDEKEIALIKKATVSETYQHYKNIEKEKNLFKKYEDAL